MAKTIRYEPSRDRHDYGLVDHLVMIDKILRITKSELDGSTTLIHLIDGTILETTDDIGTLQNRIEDK